MIEDIARYALNDENLSKRLKNIRHIARINKNLLTSRDIKNDVLKQSTKSELKRKNIKDIAIANFKRAEESARVIEELLKLDYTGSLDSNSLDSLDSNDSNDTGDIADSALFKNIRYELYDIEIEYFRIMDAYIKESK